MAKQNKSESIEIDGKTIVLTGRFSQLKRANAEEQLKALGAKVTKSISGNTDILFAGEKAGTKLAQARKLKIATYDEDALVAVLAAYEAPEEVEEAEAEPQTPSETPFSGLTIVLTGTFATMKRSDAKTMLQDAGAKISGSVSKKTDLLIHGKDAGSKASKARTLGVELMDEATMVAQLVEADFTHELFEGAEKTVKKEAAKNKKLMAKVNGIIAKVNEPQIERFGATIGNLLLLYLRVFEQRPDIHVYDKKFGGPADQSTLRRLSTQIPPEVLAFGADVGPLEFNWVFQANKNDKDGFSQGYNGGRINFVGLKDFYWWERPKDWDWCTYKEDSAFDDLVAEGNTRLSYDPGEKRTEAYLIFDDANDVERHYLGGVESYFTDGAKAGFVWYWPRVGYWEADNFTKALYDASLPKDTPIPELVEALLEKGITEEEANALVAWLGEDVVILLPQA